MSQNKTATRLAIHEGAAPEWWSCFPRYDLQDDPLAAAHRPPKSGWCYSSALMQLGDTPFVQWHGQRGHGAWDSWGPIMEIINACR